MKNLLDSCGIKRIYLILAGCCGGMLAVVIGRAAPLRVGNNAVVIRVPSHDVVLLRNGCHRQRLRHRVTFMRVFSSLIPSTCASSPACSSPISCNYISLYYRLELLLVFCAFAASHSGGFFFITVLSTQAAICSAARSDRLIDCLASQPRVAACSVVVAFLSCCLAKNALEADCSVCAAMSRAVAFWLSGWTRRCSRMARCNLTVVSRRRL